MKPAFEKVLYSTEKSFNVFELQYKYFNAPWHFHPEYELVYIRKGKGKRFVGNSTEEFYPGDLIFLGPNLPHVWLNSKDFYDEKSDLLAEAIVVQFKEDYFSSTQLSLPEFKYIKRALALASQGVRYEGEKELKVIQLFEKMVAEAGLKRYILLLELLDILGEEPNLITLAKRDYINSLLMQVPDRLQKVINYVNARYKSKISIDEIADMAYMNKSAFCRYFKEKTHKTFTQYVNEIRIDYACKLLVEGSLNVTQVCYECGFNNLSNFNRRFKEAIKKSPLEYQKSFRALA